MKTITILSILVFVGSGIINAQYRIDKNTYDYKTYTREKSDPYNPVTLGVLSVVPGLGQMVASEYGRGAAFLGGFAGCYLFAVAGAALAWDGNNEYIGAAMMLIGLAGLVAVDIWSIIDATRVAKVNNLAWRDKNNSGFNLQFEPFISPLQYDESIKTQVGLSLKVDF